MKMHSRLLKFTIDKFIIISIALMIFSSLDMNAQEESGLQYMGFLRNRFKQYDLNKSGYFYKLNSGDVKDRFLINTANLVVKKVLDNANFITDIEGTNSLLETNSTALKINECYFSLYLSDLKLFGGKKKIDWSPGIAWNPADGINYVKDPVEPKENREGAYLGGFSYNLKGFEFTGLYQLYEESKNDMFHVKLTKTIVGVDASAYFSERYHDKWKMFGLMGSKFLTNEFEVHFETSTTKGRNQQIPIVFPDSLNQMVYAFSNDQSAQSKYLTSFLFGMRYTFTSWNAFFIIEYYKNSSGYSTAEKNILFSNLNEISIKSIKNPTDLAFIAGANSISSKNYMKDYIFCTFSKTNNSENWKYGIDNIYSLSDKSYITVPRIEYVVNGKISLEAKCFLFLGDKMTEMGEKITNSVVMFNSILYF